MKKAILGLMVLLLASAIPMPVLATSTRQIPKPVVVNIAGAGGNMTARVLCAIEVVALCWREEWKGMGGFAAYLLVDNVTVQGPIAITDGVVTDGLAILYGEVTNGTWIGVPVRISGAVGVPTISVSFSGVCEVTVYGVVIVVDD